MTDSPPHSHKEKHDIGHMEDNNSYVETERHGHISSKLTMTVLWTACAAFAYGFSGANIGGVLVQPRFAADIIEPTRLDFLNGAVSIYHAGGFFGVLSSVYISDKFGRKPVFAWGTIWYIVGAVILTACQNLDMLFVGRLFLGLGAYCYLFGAQTYVVELSPATSRGLLGATVGISLEIGYIAAGWIGVGLIEWENTSWSWRFAFIDMFLPIIPVIVGYPFMPESPRWLVSKGRSEEALRVMKELHASPKDPQNVFAAQEVNQIQAQYELDRTLPSSWVSMFTTYRRRTLTACLIMFTFLLAGNYFLATYAPGLLTAFGFSTSKSLIYQSAWLTLLLLNIIVMPLIDRIGRKILLVVGVAGEGICLIILMLLTKYYGDGSSAAGRNAFVGIFLFYMVPLCFTEPPAYLMTCEIFPLHIRTKGTAIGYCTLAVTNTWVLQAASTMVLRLEWKAYLLFICITAANVTACIFFLPETKNVPLEEMAAIFGESDQVAPVSAKDLSKRGVEAKAGITHHLPTH